MSLRNIVAALAGATAYVWTLYRFLPYSERNELPVSTYQTFALALLTLGFLVTLGAGKPRYRPAALAIFAALAAHLVVIAVDLQSDATDHNLFPLELLIIAFAASPAFLGAALAHFTDTARQRLL
jgi:hypothetical protein